MDGYAAIRREEDGRRFQDKLTARACIVAK